MKLEDLANQTYCPGFSRMMINDDFRDKIQRHQAMSARSCCREIDGQLFCQNGIVTLPCGSGKTIVGVILMAIAQSRTLIVVQTVEQQTQWLKTLLRWTYLKETDVFAWTAERITESQVEASVVVLTYSRLVAFWNTKNNSIPFASQILLRKYGLVLFDEVHHLPAPENSRALKHLNYLWKIGLTATTIREDGKEE